MEYYVAIKRKELQNRKNSDIIVGKRNKHERLYTVEKGKHWLSGSKNGSMADCEEHKYSFLNNGYTLKLDCGDSKCKLAKYH